MVGQEFRQNALRTEPSREQYNEPMKRLEDLTIGSALIDKLSIIAKELSDLDEIKKHIMYGKVSGYLATYDKNIREKQTVMAHNLSTPMGIRLLHGVMGLNTEGGELIEALLKVANGQDPDTVNFMEEVGDVNWYEELIGDSMGFTIPEANARVIAKLKKRFPDKFTEGDAINRDLNTERATLEGKEL